MSSSSGESDGSRPDGATMSEARAIICLRPCASTQVHAHVGIGREQAVSQIGSGAHRRASLCTIDACLARVGSV
eukprot:6201528-Pleurochrysis_carterae.AAC.1